MSARAAFSQLTGAPAALAEAWAASGALLERRPDLVALFCSGEHSAEAHDLAELLSDQVGPALQHRATRRPRLGERRGRAGELRDRSPGAHPDFIDGLCAPLPTITTWRPAISTSRLRPAWNARLSLIVT